MSNSGRDGERGVVLILFLIVASLLVLLALGWSIDLPLSQSASVRAQLAADMGSEAAIDNFTSYQAMADLAFDHTRAAVTNTYSPSLAGYLFGLDRASNDIRIVIPRPNGAPGGGLYWLSCTLGSGCSPGAGAISSDPLYPRYQSAITGVFDQGSIDDFRNAVLVFGRFSPSSFFPLGVQSDVAVVSTSSVKPHMIYLLIDPSFTIEDNFESIFGVTPCSTDSTMWPVANPRSAGLPSYGAWLWPSTGSALRRRPASGLPRTNSAFDECIKRYYSTMCDTQPFFSFKRGIVGLVDRLSQSSAFASTTMVGLTGYGEFGNNLVPIHPKFAVTPPGAVCPGEVAQHWYPGGGSTFPLGDLPAGAESTENRGLHSVKTTAFEGYVDSRTPDLSANRTRNCGSANQISGTGLNKWELCFCRGLYTAEGPNEFLMVDDESGSDEPLLAHRIPARRRRGIGGLNWCDDDSLGGVDLTVNLTSGRDNTGGDTVRNIISGLAMRAEDPRLFRVEHDINLIGTWIRPAVGNLTMQTGWRDLAPALRMSAQALDRAFTEYMASPIYNSLRPIDQRDRTVVLFGFGAWSQIVEEQMEASLGPGATSFDAVQALRTRLRDALAEVVCNRKMRLISAFLPMRYHDKFTLNELTSLLEQLEEIYRAQSQGIAPPPGSIPDFDTVASCQVGRIQPPQTFIFDFDSSRYSAITATHLRKLQASLAFGREIPRLILRLLVESEFRT